MSAPSCPAPSADRLLTSEQVAERLAVTVRTLWRMLARGEVPPPIRYNRKLVRWSEFTIARYLAELQPAE